MSEFIVPAIAPRFRHLAGGPEEARRVFSFPFPAVNATDIAVHRDGTRLEGGYAVAFAEDRQGGSVTFDTAVPEGAEIVILRSTVIERATDFVENGAFRASALNLELDRLTMIAQELDLAGRAGLHRDPSEVGPELVLPAPSARANGLLGFSADGLTLAVLPVESLRGETGETGPQGMSGDMSGANNLSELTDPAMARANLDVADWGELNGSLSTLDGSIRNLDLNLALNTLQDSIEAGWTVMGMVDGFVDVFSDQTGVSIPHTDVTVFGTASASSTFSGSYPASNALTGALDGWASANGSASGAWWQIAFSAARTVSRIDIATSASSAVSATLKPQYHDGSSWIDLAGSITTIANTSAPDSFTFDPVEATQFRLLYSAGTNNIAYLRRVWFYEGSATGLSSGQTYDEVGDYYAPLRTQTLVGDAATSANIAFVDSAGVAVPLSGLGGGVAAISAIVDNSASTYCMWNYGGHGAATAGLNFRLDLGEGNAGSIGAFSITHGKYTSDTGNSLPPAWKLQWSDDGDVWTDSGASVSGANGDNVKYSSPVAVVSAHRYWRILCTQNSINSMIFGTREVEFLEYDFVTHAMTLVSAAVTADDEPAAARAVLLVEPLETITPNTDLICEVSRDDGESWTVLTLSREVVFESGLELLAGAEASLEMQPSGTAMRIRLQAPTSRRIQVKGWALQWR